MAKTIVAPVLYTQGRAGGPRWEALSFSVVKELRRKRQHAQEMMLQLLVNTIEEKLHTICSS